MNILKSALFTLSVLIISTSVGVFVKYNVKDIKSQVQTELETSMVELCTANKIFNIGDSIFYCHDLTAVVNGTFMQGEEIIETPSVE